MDVNTPHPIVAAGRTSVRPRANPTARLGRPVAAGAWARSLAVLLCGAVLLGTTPGCVTEARPLKGLPVRPAAGPGSALPDGPLARPAGAASATGRVIAGVATIGSIEYDGLTLPLLSPSGAFVAVHQGPAPTWEALTAQGRAEPSAGRIARLHVRERALEPVAGALADELAGAVPGRSADESGFLVEQPMPDGSRRVGKVEWSSGQVAWLVQDRRVNAHAVMLRDGALIFASRTVESARFSLMLLPPGAATPTVLAEADDAATANATATPSAAGPRHGSLEFPMLSPDQTTLIVQQVLDTPERRGIRWRSWIRGSAGEPWTPGTSIDVVGTFAPSTTFMAASPMDAAPSAPGAAPEAAQCVAIIEPRAQSVALLNGRSRTPIVLPRGTLIAAIAGAGRLTPGSIGDSVGRGPAPNLAGTTGLLSADGQSVSWRPWDSSLTPDGSNVGPVADPAAGEARGTARQTRAGQTSVLSGPGLARVLDGEAGGALLIVPEGGRSTKLALLRLRILDPEQDN